jgi:hypothetical protein
MLRLWCGCEAIASVTRWRGGAGAGAVVAVASGRGCGAVRWHRGGCGAFAGCRCGVWVWVWSGAVWGGGYKSEVAVRNYHDNRPYITHLRQRKYLYPCLIGAIYRCRFLLLEAKVSVPMYVIVITLVRLTNSGRILESIAAKTREPKSNNKTTGFEMLV